MNSEDEGNAHDHTDFKQIEKSRNIENDGIAASKACKVLAPVAAGVAATKTLTSNQTTIAVGRVNVYNNQCQCCKQSCPPKKPPVNPSCTCADKPSSGSESPV